MPRTVSGINVFFAFAKDVATGRPDHADLCLKFFDEYVRLPLLQEAGMDVVMHFRGKRWYELALRVTRRFLGRFSVTLED